MGMSGSAMMHKPRVEYCSFTRVTVEPKPMSEATFRPMHLQTATEHSTCAWEPQKQPTKFPYRNHGVPSQTRRTEAGSTNGNYARPLPRLRTKSETCKVYCQLIDNDLAAVIVARRLNASN